MPHPSTPFGEELRKRRLEAGLSLTDLSGLVHYSKAQLSKVERGIKAPSRDLARLCDAAFGTDGALIALSTPTAVDSPAVSAPGRVEEENWMMQLPPDGPNSFGPVGRREVMNAGVASLMTWRSDGSGPASPTAGAGMLEASHSLFTHYRRLGQTVEPGLLLPVLIAQTHAAGAVVTERQCHQASPAGARFPVRRVRGLAGAGDRGRACGAVVDTARGRPGRRQR
ncbi:hypothetical protein GCM10010372_44070 [Streptomyces tauricus]|nr:hypothetical protein GCM10010372_44070 [Streptomyces tauricus]